LTAGGGRPAPAGRDLRALPKAHLHLHFTGSLRPDTMRDLARAHAVRLPESLLEVDGTHTPELHATDERGWFRFQRLYDTARSVVRSEADVRRLVREAAEDDRDEGSGWLEIQVDPTSYAPHLGGLTPAVEVVLDAAREAQEATGVGVGVIVAANRTRHPLDARTLARLAARYAGHGVVGFGLSNDERRGRTEEFGPAFRIATRAGLLSTPHGGELAGSDSVRLALDCLGAQRVGHGVRSAEDPALLDRLAAAGVTLEVCPVSNVRLGVYDRLGDVPLRRLRAAGVPVALGADDPLLFGARLLATYEAARAVHGFTDEELAELARCSVRGSRAPAKVTARLLAGIDDWLAAPPEPA
jgi:adenosine deaminase